MINKILTLVFIVVMVICACYWIDQGNIFWSVYCILVGLANSAVLLFGKEKKADK